MYIVVVLILRLCISVNPRVTPGWSCTVILSLLVCCSSDSSKDSTYLLGSHASLPPEPVNHADQNLRGLKQEPGVSQALHFILFTCVVMCQLLNYGSKTGTRLC